MLSSDARHDVSGLVDAIRERPQEFPIAQLGRLMERGVDVSIEQLGANSLVYLAPLPDPVFERLTTREYEVATLVAGGFSNAQVASALFVSLATIKDHMHAILGKTELASRAQVIAAWYGGMQQFDL